MKNPVRLVNRVNFEKELQEKKLECEDMIRKYLPKEEGFAAQLAEAMNYSMEAGGKRLRPILMGETYRMFGGTSAIIEPFQAAMEMIHTSSLIHDDLPAIDNDLYRRGKKTTHCIPSVHWFHHSMHPGKRTMAQYQIPNIEQMDNPIHFLLSDRQKRQTNIPES